MIDPFFERAPTKWNIADFTRVFLENAPDQEPTFNYLTSVWTNSIDAIYRDPTQTNHRRDKAKSLREQWDMNRHKKSSEHKLAKEAYKNFEKTRPQSTIIGLINNGHIAGNVQTLCTETSAEAIRGPTSGAIAQDKTRKKRNLSEQPTTDSSAEDSAQDKKEKKKKKKKKRERNTSIDENPKYQFLARFAVVYNNMVPEKKWTLSSGRAVEDIIYSHASLLDKQTVTHLFILDPEDSSLRDSFTDPEWLEIVSHLEDHQKTLRDVPMPECLDCIPNEVTTTKQLREILYSSKLQQGPDEEWVFDVYRQFLFLLEHPDKPLTRNNCENWLEIFVIGPLVHRCLMSVEGIMFRCKEAPSVATRRVNNKNRTETGEGNYLLPGPRLDGIFRLLSPDFEFGACEVGKDDKGPEDTKRIDDFRKLIVTLSHMLLRLHRELSVTSAEELQVVGFMCSGLTLQPLRMYSPNGYVCFLARDRTLRIPANALRIKDIRPLLHSIWLLKKTMSDSVALVLGSDARSSQ